MAINPVAFSTSLLCTCPLGAAITDISAQICPEDFGQIQRIIFQRLYSTGTTKNKFTIASTNPNVQATWTTVETAADGTKAQFSPLLDNPQMEAGGKREFGGGNETRNGIPYVLGSEPASFTSSIARASQNIISEMKELMCENIAVYFVNESGQIAGLADDNTNATEFYPIPVQSLFVGDKVFGGYEGVDTNALELMLPANWSDQFYIVTPTDFNPLTDF